MNTIVEYLDNYLKYPINLDASKNLFSNTFVGILIRKDKVINVYHNIDNMLNYFKENHTMVKDAEDSTISLHTCEKNPKVIYGTITSVQTHKMDDGTLETFKVEDKQIYEYDDNDKICFIQHSWNPISITN